MGVSKVATIQANVCIHEKKFKTFSKVKVFQRIGALTYKLELPKEGQIQPQIHPVFHVPVLKPKVGPNVTIQSQLPSENKKVEMILNPQAVLNRQMWKRRQKILINWQGLSTADATWEDFDLIKKIRSQIFFP